MALARVLHSSTTSIRSRAKTLITLTVFVLAVQAFLAFSFFYDVEKREQTARSDSHPPSLGQVAIRSQNDDLPEENNELTCKVTGRTALAALKRAQTPLCKAEIIRVACSIQNKTLYPPSLPNYCPREGAKRGQYLGCYADSSKKRLIKSHAVRLEDNTPEKCVNLCIQNALPFAGVEYGKQCFCGALNLTLHRPLDDSACNMPCPKERALTCGGNYTIQLYETGVDLRESLAINEDESPFNSNSTSTRVVFLLSLNGRSVRQVKRLLKAIYRPQHYYYLHVDARQTYLHNSVEDLPEKYSNLVVTTQRFASIWGGASLLRMLLNALQEITAFDWKWDFVLNLSESDFPIRSMEQLVHFLGANPGRNFVKSHGRKVSDFIKKQGLDRVFLECEYRMWRVGERELPTGVRWDGGSDWVILSRDFVEYTLSNRDPLVTGLKTFFNYTLLPAESFFHVLLLNSPFCDSYYDHNLRLTLWRRSQGCKCQYKHVVDWCGCSPMVYRRQDWTRLLTGHKSYLMLSFARKFDATIDQSVIKDLEPLINIQQNSTALDSYWENIYHYQDGTSASQAFVVLANSMVELALEEGKCKGKSHIMAITSYFAQDKYRGDLILFNVDEETYELWFQPTLNVVKLPVEFVERLEELSVGSNYDVKEQVIRNRILALNNATGVGVMYKFSQGQALNGTLILLDPEMQLRALHNIYISDTSQVDYFGFEVPVWKGIWRVGLMLNNTLSAYMDFLVLDGTNMDATTVPHWSKTWLHWASQLAALSATTNGTNSVLKRFYTVNDICTKNKNSLCWSSETLCHDTKWSSLSPDPKSDF